MRYDNYKVLGVGNNDMRYKSVHIEKYQQCCKVWNSMLRRCYSEKYHKYKPTYMGCSVCDEWLTLSNFYQWFIVNYKEGFVLDKDILVFENKQYSPNTCCFVPPMINSLVLYTHKNIGKCCNGVYLKDGKYIAQIGILGKNQKKIGAFDNEEDAFNAYKIAKRQAIKDVATIYLEKGEIDNRIYNALLNIEIKKYK